MVGDGESPRDRVERLEWLEHIEGYFIHVSGTLGYFCVGRIWVRGEGTVLRGASTGGRGIYSVGHIREAFIGGAGYFTRVSGTLDFSRVERNPQTYVIRREKDVISPHS